MFFTAGWYVASTSRDEVLLDQQSDVVIVFGDCSILPIRGSSPRIRLATPALPPANKKFVGWAPIFSHFMCMEKTSGLKKTCASLWSSPISFSLLYVILPLYLKQ